MATKHNTRLLLALLLGAAGTGCGQQGDGKHGEPPTETVAGDTVGQRRVWLEAETDGEDVQLRVRFERPLAGSGPRVAEIVIERSDNLELVSAGAGEAAEAAGKQVVVQEQPDGALRVLMFAPGNVTELGSGAIAQLHLRRTGAAAAKLDLRTDKPLFAPAQANEGLRIGEPLQID